MTDTEKSHTYNFVKKLVLLALLPVEKIKLGYEIIYNQYKVDFKYDERIEKFLRYFEKQWLKNPHNICVHDEKHRTNNAVEQYHRTINKSIKKTPTPAVFLSKHNVLYFMLKIRNLISF